MLARIQCSLMRSGTSVAFSLKRDCPPRFNKDGSEGPSLRSCGQNKANVMAISATHQAMPLKMLGIEDVVFLHRQRHLRQTTGISGPSF